MKTFHKRLLLLPLLLTDLHSQDLSPDQARMAQQLTPEERQQAQQLTPEQIQRAKDLMSSNPDLFNQMAGQKGVQVRKDSLGSKSVIGQREEIAKKEEGIFKIVPQDSLKGKADSARAQDTTVAGKRDTAKAQKARENEVYGVHLFSDRNTGNTVVDVPEEYVIVPGDQILLRLWGRYNLEKIYTVGQDGYVFLDPLNKQTYLKGTTHRRLKQMIGDVVKQMAGVEGEAKVIASHPISIHVSGFAREPGTMLVLPYFPFWQVLMQSKGPSRLGSVREINLIRDNKVIHTFDIYDYLQTGKIANVGLMNHDVLFFSEKKKLVKVQGLTNITGTFEMKPSETLGDLVAVAGNLSSEDISPVVHIERKVPMAERAPGGPTNLALDLKLLGENWKAFQLQDGDVIGELQKKYDLRNQVYLAGKGVKVPGKYSIQHGQTTLGEVVAKAGGLDEGYYNKMEVIRKTPGGWKSISVEPGESAFNSFLLESKDSILTYHASDFRDSSFIHVHGFVRKSDTLLYAESMTLKEVIQRAGGVRNGSLPYVFVKQTDSLGIVNYKKVELKDAESYVVQPRDEVVAYDYREFNREFPVTVLVEHRPPKYVQYSDELDLEYIVHSIGGILPNMDSSRIEIHYPNHEAATYRIDKKVVDASGKEFGERGIIKPGAVIIFRYNPLKALPSIVTLVGEFKRPGQYVLKSKTETVESIIQEAGGLDQRANPFGIAIKRDNVPSILPVEIKSASPLVFKGKIPLVRGDTVFVQDNNSTVTISGAVLNSGTTQFIEGQSWQGYIDQGAGGHLDTADIEKTYIIYPNGTAAKASVGWLRDAPIRPGSEIVVPFKPYREPSSLQPFDYAKLSAVITSVLGLLLTGVIIMEKVNTL